jgi:hypothetical protein
MAEQEATINLAIADVLKYGRGAVVVLLGHDGSLQVGYHATGSDTAKVLTTLWCGVDQINTTLARVVTLEAAPPANSVPV